MSGRYLQKTISMLGRPRGEYHFFNTYFYRKLEEATSQRVSFLRYAIFMMNLFQYPVEKVAQLSKKVCSKCCLPRLLDSSSLVECPSSAL